jgi:hypothetical protein
MSPHTHVSSSVVQRITASLDARIVELCYADPRVVRWLFARDCAPTRALPRDDIASRRQRDVLVRCVVSRAVDVVYHLEVQTRADADLPTRMLRYLLDVRDVLGETQSTLEQGVLFVRRPRGVSPDVRHRLVRTEVFSVYRTFALSELHAHEMLACHLPLLGALVPATRGGTTWQALHQSLQRVVSADVEPMFVTHFARLHGALAELFCGEENPWHEVAMSIQPSLIDAVEDDDLDELFAPMRRRLRAEGARLGRQEGERRGREAGERLGREEGERLGREEGERLGRQRAVRDSVAAVLSARGLAFTPLHAATLERCDDLAQLQTWLERAAVVERVDDVFGD